MNNQVIIKSTLKSELTFFFLFMTLAIITLFMINISDINQTTNLFNLGFLTAMTFISFIFTVNHLIKKPIINKNNNL